MDAKFGPAGNSLSFSKMGYKNNTDIPKYVKAMGLNAYEYQCGRGVHISDEAAVRLGELAKNEGISLSLHAPYYISLSGIEEEKRLGSIDYILKSANAVNLMGGNRIVVHSGSCSKISREEALELAKDTLSKARRALVSEGLENVRICPETMGKINQLGTLEEVIELCKISDSFIPCVDFGHLNARTFGGLSDREAFKSLFDKVENELGIDRLREMHVHFSKIEYTGGGEKRHLTFLDNAFGPDYEPMCELFARKKASPTIICESDGTQAEDAKTMMDYFIKCSER